MAKSKNKKAKTTVYDEPDDGKYIVITNPFGMRAGARNDKDLQILSGWLGEMFGRRISVSAVYTMSTVCASPKIDLSMSC